MTDEVVRKQIMDEARENIAYGRAIQRREQCVEIPDRLTAYRREAEAQKAVEVDETTRRVAEARLTQIEREIRSAMVASDIDNRIRIALENERAVLEEAVGQAIARFVKMKIRLLEAKLKKLER